tara:strand:- start:179 stop:805 length:627 start_codon:yes stop_codon:yes gene_type:complete
MKTRRQIEKRLMNELDDGHIALLQWVLESPDCPMCEHRDRIELEVKLHKGEITSSFLEQKHGWLPGSVNVHMEDHLEYDPVRAGLIEAMRQESISTLNIAENAAMKINGWIEELEAQRFDGAIDTDWITDATKLTGQLNGFLRLVGVLKKEIGVDSQLLLAQQKMDGVMQVLVDTLKSEPALLDQIQFRLAALRQPRTLDAEFEVMDE